MMFMDKVLCFLVVLVKLSHQDFAFKNVSLSWDARVDDLVGRLTAEEMIQQMSRGGAGMHGPTPAISRLGIGTYQFDSECLHGVRNHNATSFPISIGLAATFSYDTVHSMAESIGMEVRAYHNQIPRNGMSCFAPVINIMRDPRWGRNQETYGEDPYLSGMMATAFVKGIHGNHHRYVTATAGCKHFNVHGGPENIPVSRSSFDAKVTERDWRTTFLPAFRYCVKAGTFSLMCSYNRINGVPACANKHLLTEVLRHEWGFKGYVVSDLAALEQIVIQHHYSPDFTDAAVKSVEAGCNLELSGTHSKDIVFYHLSDGVKTGKIKESLLRERVKPLFYTRMRLGEFDPDSMNPYRSTTTAEIESRGHRNIAVEAAMKSFVLLKNDGLLPLKHAKYTTIAVVGPMADQASLLGGGYQARPDSKFVSTPRQGLESLGGKTHFASGCHDTLCAKYDSQSVITAVHGVDVVFICIGLGTPIEREAHDRKDLKLPGHQQQLIDDVIKHNGAAKIVLITFNAGPVNLEAAYKNSRVSAILAAFYPGQGTGVALRKALTEANSSKFGRLPYTWYLSTHQVPPMVNYSMEGRTYRYFHGDPLFPFGYGLSYTKFHFDNLKMVTTVIAGHDIHGSVVVHNIGNHDGDEVVQVYISWAEKSTPSPRLQLVSFNRVTIPTKGQATVKFTIKADQMAVWIDNSGWKVEAGKINVYIGGQQPNQKMSVGSNVLQGHFNIHGNKLLGKY